MTGQIDGREPFPFSVIAADGKAILVELEHGWEGIILREIVRRHEIDEKAAKFNDVSYKGTPRSNAVRKIIKNSDIWSERIRAFIMHIEKKGRSMTDEDVTKFLEQEYHRPIKSRKGSYPVSSDAFLDNLKSIDGTQTEQRNGTTYYINEFWTARQRQSHRLHEISYRACFKPQLPAFFIDRLSQPGDIVYDPFMGRGTTPIEAALRGRVPYGNDINPLSRHLTEPRINPPSLAQVTERLTEIPWAQFTDIDHEDLLAFYHPTVLAQLEGLRRWLRERIPLDQTDRWLCMVALSRLTGHSSGFFSGYTLPPNQAVSVARQRQINARHGQTPPLRDIPQIITKKSRSLLSDGSALEISGMFLTTDALRTRSIPDAIVTLTVTSPPFIDVVNYEADNWLRCWFLGIDPSRVRITTLRSVAEWQAFIEKTLTELVRVTGPGGYIAFEVGEVRRGTVRLDEQVIAAAEWLPLDVVCVVVNRQAFTKTSHCWGVANNLGGTNTNRIVVMQRHG